MHLLQELWVTEYKSKISPLVHERNMTLMVLRNDWNSKRTLGLDPAASIYGTLKDVDNPIGCEWVVNSSRTRMVYAEI